MNITLTRWLGERKETEKRVKKENIVKIKDNILQISQN